MLFRSIGAAAQQWMSDFSFETHTDWTLTGVKSETGNTTNIVFAQRTTDANVEEELSLVREDRDGRTAGVSVVVPTAWQSSQVRQG